MAYLYADEIVVGNGIYTNASRIAMSATGVSELRCFVKLPNTDTFVTYSQFAPFYASGRYEFYAQDESQNKFNIVWIVIDRKPKLVNIIGIIDGVATSDVTLNWIDCDADATANIMSVTVNGKEYTKGDIGDTNNNNNSYQIREIQQNLIQTIDSGTYTIQSIDQAGNIWTTTFVAKRDEVLTKTLNFEYYETSIDN